MEAKLQTLGHRTNKAQAVIQYLFQHPMVDAQKVKELTNLSLPSVYKLINDLESLKILKEITGGKRDKVYLFDAYINLFR